MINLCPTTQTVAPCTTVFDCVTSKNSFVFNNNNTIDILCGSQVPLSLLWVGCDGERAPDFAGGGVGLSVNIGSEVFDSSNGLTNNYIYTLPTTEGNHTLVATWGNSNDPELCSVTINFNCVSNHQPAVVEVIGHGTQSDFGNNGPVLTVTNLNDSGPGSFRAAVDQTGPRQIVFNAQGVVPTQSQILINDPNLTIRGSTAPGTGFKLQAVPSLNEPLVRVVTTDVLVENLGMYQNNDSTGDVQNRDTLNISTNAGRVVFSQCTMMWGADETISIYHGQNLLSDITLQYCLIAEGLSNTGHPSGEHSKGVLVGEDVDRVSLHHNWFTRNARRNPRIQGDLAQIVNNVIISNCDDRFRPITIGDNDPNSVSRFDVMHNKVYGNDGPERGVLLYPETVFNDGQPNIHAVGNIGPGRTSDAQPQIDFFGAYGGVTPTNFNLIGSPHVGTSTAMCTHTDMTTDELRDFLYLCVGAHSWNRNVNDQRVIDIQPDTLGCTDTAIQLY